jgi:hypothetical protein
MRLPTLFLFCLAAATPAIADTAEDLRFKSLSDRASSPTMARRHIQRGMKFRSSSSDGSLAPRGIGQ